MKIDKVLKSALVIGVLSIVSAAAYSETEGYGGIGVSVFELSATEASDDATLNTLNGKFGLSFSDYFSGEFRFGFGMGDENIDFFGDDISVELNQYYGLYARAGVPATEVIYPYFVLGYTRSEIEVTYDGDRESDSDSDFSYGVGVDFRFAEAAYFNVEYIQLYDNDDTEIGGLNIGVTVSF